MTTSLDSQNLESFVQVYDAIPPKWEDAQPYLVEQLKNISEGVNTRIIGFYLDVELLTGGQFVPGVTVPGNNPGVYRDILRIVVDVSPLVMGLNTYAHGITFNTNFTLIDLWVSGTNSTTTLTALTISGNNVVMDATNLLITSPQDFDRAWAVIEYIQEL
jgi:hypothetical protein